MKLDTWNMKVQNTNYGNKGKMGGKVPKTQFCSIFKTCPIFFLSICLRGYLKLEIE